MFKETINEERLINYLTWYLPNSKEIKISDFCSILENNLSIDWDWMNKFRNLSWSIRSDYRRLFENLNTNQKITIWKYFVY